MGISICSQILSTQENHTPFPTYRREKSYSCTSNWFHKKLSWTWQWLQRVLPSTRPLQVQSPTYGTQEEAGNPRMADHLKTKDTRKLYLAHTGTSASPGQRSSLLSGLKAPNLCCRMGRSHQIYSTVIAPSGDYISSFCGKKTFLMLRLKRGFIILFLLQFWPRWSTVHSLLQLPKDSTTSPKIRHKETSRYILPFSKYGLAGRAPVGLSI